MEEHQVQRPRLRRTGVLLSLSGAIISEAISDIQHLIRGQYILGQSTGIGGNFSSSDSTASLVSNGAGLLLASHGLGLVSPLISYFAREVIMSFDKPAQPVGQVRNPLEVRLEGLQAELNQQMGQILWKLEPMNETLEEIYSYVKEPAMQWSEEKRLNAERWYRQGLVDEAVDALQEAISPQNNPTNSAAHRLLGHILLYERKDFRQALHHFQKAAQYIERAIPRDTWHAIELEIEEAECHLFASVAAYLNGEIVTALAECEAAIRLDFGLSEAYYIRAKCLVQLGRDTEAAVALEQAITGIVHGSSSQLEFEGDPSYYFFAAKDTDLQQSNEVQALIQRLEERVHEQIRQNTTFVPINDGKEDFNKMQLPSNELQNKLGEYQQTVQAFKNILPAQDVAKIENVLTRLENQTISISAFGVTGSGKSALLNSLLGFDNSKPEECPFKVDEQINAWSDTASIRNGQKWKLIDGIDLVIYDTPGIGGDFKDHQAIANEIADSSDIILFVLEKQVSKIYKPQLEEIVFKPDKAVIAVINQIDRLTPAEKLARKDHLLENYPIQEDMIVYAAGKPYDFSNDRLLPPRVEDLTAKIAELIEAKGTKLIEETIQAKLGEGALNAEAILRESLRKEQERLDQERKHVEKNLDDKKANAEILIDRYAKVAAGFAAAMPFGLDALTDALISSGMFVHIARTYQKEFDLGTLGTMIKDLITTFFGVLSASGLTGVGYLIVTKGAKTNPVTYAVGMIIDGAVTYFLICSVGYTFSILCYEQIMGGHKREASEIMSQYIRENIDEKFLNKIPSRIKNRFFNFDFNKT
jgi:tetratricopeptide (TPR) repeat protein